MTPNHTALQAAYKFWCIPNIGIHRASISKMYEIQNSCHWVKNNGGPPMSRETAYCLARGPPPMCRETAYWTPTS